VEQLRRDIERLLGDSPRVTVFTSGEGVVIDGVVNSRAEYDRIQQIVSSSAGDVYSLADLDERQIPERQQVQLHFQFVEVERNNDHNIGMDWSQGPVQLVLDTVSTVRFGVTAALDSYIDLTSTGVVSRRLDQDFITCASGESVTYHRGGELLFEQRTVSTSTLVTKEYGLLIEARPIVDDDGDIDLILDYELSVPAGEVNGIPALRKHSHEVSVQLQEGQSFALSGWYTRDRSRTITGIPGLKDIPVLGLLFGSRDFRRGNTDGIIIVTPVVLDQGGQKMRRQIRETMDLYEQAEVKW
jgi:pilus assembly protein CpaC